MKRRRGNGSGVIKVDERGPWRGRASDASSDRASGNQLIGLIPFRSDALGAADELSETRRTMAHVTPGMGHAAGCPSHARLKGVGRVSRRRRHRRFLTLLMAKLGVSRAVG